ncbi:MAG: hemolysin family protein [Candidatus Tantalella remota]|nr:hemolysin family protein [Candidatus Tantalella remota]
MDTALFVILLLASAFFSSSETAFLSLDRITLRQMEETGRPSEHRVISLLSRPRKLLVTILVGNTLVNIAASSVLGDFFYGLMGESGVPFSIITMTVVVLIFGEVTPKMFALANAKDVSCFVSMPISFFEKVFSPARSVLLGIAYAIVKPLGIKAFFEEPKITEQEIRSHFSLGKKHGVVKGKEKDMIDSILEFKESNSADIMTPRIDMDALDITLSREEITEQIKESQYSRYPVYVHTLDNIVGLIHSKDFLLNPNVPIKSVIRKPYFAPESMKVDDLLQELQKNHTHMAVITDEYGVTSGLVTIEDIMEEIVGEIRDELDFESPNIHMVDQKKYEVSGQTHIDEVNEEIGLEIETEEVDTIGGYVILVIGKIPQSGDSIKIGDFTVTVEDVSKNRITSLTIEKGAGKDNGKA